MNRRVVLTMVFLLFLVLGMTALLVARRTQEKGPASLPPAINQVAWRGVAPGKTAVGELGDRLGPPLNIEPSRGGSTLYYPSTSGNWPTAVVESRGVVRFVREHVFAPADTSYANRVRSFLEGPVVLYGPEFESGRNLYVFPGRGIALLANKDANYVFEVWYFQPSTLEALLTLPQFTLYKARPHRPPSVGF